MTLAPEAEAPSTMLIAAISLSAWSESPPRLGIFFAMYSESSVCGVMGYPKNSLQPARIAASAIASLPFIKSFSAIAQTPFSTVITTSGHIVAHMAQAMHFSVSVTVAGW